MTSLALMSLPAALQSIRTRPLFVMQLEVKGPVVVGPTPGASRRVGIITGGRFEGERLSGTVLDGGNDWQTEHTDGATGLDVRVLLRTTDDALITMTYRGLRHGPKDVMARLAKGEAVDPAAYYFRISPLFETAAPQYAWLNNVLAVGTGHRLPDGPVYSLFEVL
ncbi:MAG TPA: DUF3237 domain-containing protein [Rhizomicrobium sp.]|nr:DUF3237 domain-containing protein [Rhizomicrobium sp.]